MPGRVTVVTKPGSTPQLAQVHQSFQAWQACVQATVGPDIAEEYGGKLLLEDAPKFKTPNTEETAEAALGGFLKAQGECLQAHPLAGLDQQYWGPAPGDVFEPPPFPLSIYWPF